MWLTASIPPPAVNPVSLEEAKWQCRVIHDDDDDYIEHLIVVALDHVEKYCGALFASRTGVFEASGWGDLSRLPSGPVTSVTGITYVDTIGDDQTVNPTVYELRLGGAFLRPGSQWPAAQLGSRITVTAEVGAAECPPAVKHAILLLVSDMYERREPEPAVERTTLDNLLSNHRYYA